MSSNSSSFGYAVEYSGVSESGLNPSQTFSTGKVQSTTVAVAGDQTLTADIVVGGFLLHDPSGGVSTVTYPDAADIIAKIGAVEGTSVDFTHRNTADAAESIVIVGGADMSMSGNLVINQGQQATWRIVVTSPTTVTAYGMGVVSF